MINRRDIKKVQKNFLKRDYKRNLEIKVFIMIWGQVFEPSIEAQEVNQQKRSQISQESTQKAVTDGNQNILNALDKSNTIDSEYSTNTV